ncbi:hypothetical protein ACOMHN_046834 [Nucella lapillus]
MLTTNPPDISTVDKTIDSGEQTPIIAESAAVQARGENAATKVTSRQHCSACCVVIPKATQSQRHPSLTDLQYQLQRIHTDLTINVTTLSKTRRKKSSALDQRPSSRLFGGMAVGFLVLVVVLVVLADLARHA